jgi:hypothetical protein
MPTHMTQDTCVVAKQGPIALLSVQNREQGTGTTRVLFISVMIGEAHHFQTPSGWAQLVS